MTALSLLDWRPSDEPADSPEQAETLDARFQAFHARNPHVYAALVRLAREWRAVRGPAAVVGVKTLYEVARWQLSLSTTGEAWALNNSYTSRYARLVMREPGLAGIFELRELRS